VKASPVDPAAGPVSDGPLWNLPNGLTTLRLLSVPVLAWLLSIDDGQGTLAREAAAAVFVLASVTDIMDGAIARSRGLVTTFGKVADPIADKALTGTALLGLSLLGELPWWVTGLILVREIGVTLLRFWVIRHGVIPASRGGKAKALAQTVAITMYLVDVPWFDWWSVARAVVMGVALVLTVGTGLDYVARVLRLRRQARVAGANPAP
jgi:CDP-diacylglycerol--glycerol-3-phosphate 3-phosphatidyltransferase